MGSVHTTAESVPDFLPPCHIDYRCVLPPVPTVSSHMHQHHGDEADPQFPANHWVQSTASVPCPYAEYMTSQQV